MSFVSAFRHNGLPTLSWLLPLPRSSAPLSVFSSRLCCIPYAPCGASSRICSCIQDAEYVCNRDHHKSLDSSALVYIRTHKCNIVLSCFTLPFIADRIFLSPIRPANAMTLCADISPLLYVEAVCSTACTSVLDWCYVFGSCDISVCFNFSAH